MQRRSLPRQLGPQFAVAEARSLGVPPGRLRARDLRAPFRGVRMSPSDDELCRLLALQTVLPSSAGFSHSTAALLWLLPLPLALQSYAALHVTVPAGASRPRRQGVVAHRGDRDLEVWRTLRRTSLGATWCDLATQLSVTELVQAGDVILNREGWDVPALEQAVAEHPGQRGRTALRSALHLVRPGSGSPRETLLRLLFAEWGLPEPELNAHVSNEAGWLATVDFLWREQGVVAECYGAVHGPTWKQDLARAALLEDEGLRVVVITDDDVRRRQLELRARLERLLA